MVEQKKEIWNNPNQILAVCPEDQKLDRQHGGLQIWREQVSQLWKCDHPAKKSALNPSWPSSAVGRLRERLVSPLSRASPGKGLLEWAGLNLSFRRKPYLFTEF